MRQQNILSYLNSISHLDITSIIDSVSAEIERLYKQDVVDEETDVGVYVLHFPSRSFLYTSNEVRLFGTDGINTGEIKLDYFFTRQHPVDQQIMSTQMDSYIVKFVSERAHTELKDWHFSFNFRILDSDGITKHFLGKFKVVSNPQRELIFICGKSVEFTEFHWQDQYKIVLNITRNKAPREKHTITFYPLDTVNLTNRELEVARLLALGKTSMDIARDLFISKNTVRNHRQNIMKKAECKSVVELVHYLTEKGYLN